MASVLEPSERLVWQGKPRGYPPVRNAALAYAVILLIAVSFLSLLLGARIALFLHPPFSFFAFVSGKIVLAPHWNGGYTPVVLLAIVGALELCRVRAWRARQYWISDRRVLATDWRGLVIAQLPRSATLEARVEGRSLVFREANGLVRFESLEDPGAARLAVAPLPPRRDPT